MSCFNVITSNVKKACMNNVAFQVRWQNRKIGKYKCWDEIVLMNTSVGQAQAAGYDVNTGLEFEIESKQTSGNKKKDLSSIVYNTGASDSNVQFVKSNTFEYHVKSDILSNTLDDQPTTARYQPFQQPSGIRIPVVWSYLEEGQGKWTRFSADNNTKLETDWLNKRKSSLVSIFDKRHRVVFAKMTMSAIPVKEEKSQVTFRVKRNEKLYPEGCHEQQMSEVGPGTPGV